MCAGACGEEDGAGRVARGADQDEPCPCTRTARQSQEIDVCHEHHPSRFAKESLTYVQFPEVPERFPGQSSVVTMLVPSSDTVSSLCPYSKANSPFL